MVDSIVGYHHSRESCAEVGKKAFMFSLIEESEIVAAIQAKFATEWGTATVEIKKIGGGVGLKML
jgi:hypothetical protein